MILLQLIMRLVLLVELAQRNCDRCKHDGSCTFDMWKASLDKIKCKHDNFGTVTEFDKFERK